MKPFILNDETKRNSYGFRVLNKGIDLNRFKNNPVMLNQHDNNTSQVVGRWKNIRIEGSLLLADPEFDTVDDIAKKLAGKVERGFIKACSMGISFAPADMSKQNSEFVLLKSELYEASICAIPSNANALTLYNTKGVKLSVQEVYKTLSLTTDKNNNNMDLLKALIDLLQLKQDATEEEVLQAVTDLVQSQQDNAQQKADEAIDMAILSGAILPTERQFYKDSAKENAAFVIKHLQKIKPKNSLATQVKNTKSGDGRETWKLSDWRKNAPDELEKNPQLFESLYKKEYGE